MNNLRIEKTNNNTYVVIADSERFGNNAIVFESYNFNECKDYAGKHGEFTLIGITEDNEEIETLIKEFDMVKSFDNKANMMLVKLLATCLDSEKKSKLYFQCYRNNYLTSARALEDCYIVKYKDGLYIGLYGTRTSFTVFINNQGVAMRKPNDINKIWSKEFKLNESDYISICK